MRACSMCHLRIYDRESLFLMRKLIFVTENDVSNSLLSLDRVYCLSRVSNSLKNHKSVN